MLDSVYIHSQVTGCQIPPIIRHCVEAILSHGLELEGLFRIPGPAGIIDEYKMEFEVRSVARDRVFGM